MEKLFKESFGKLYSARTVDNMIKEHDGITEIVEGGPKSMILFRMGDGQILSFDKMRTELFLRKVS